MSSKRDKEKQLSIDQWQANIPQELKELPNWVLWRYETEKGQRKKPAYSTDGKRANPSNSATWTYFQTVVNAYRDGRYNGIGFEFGNSEFMGIDIDHCIDQNGKVSEMASDIVQTIGVGYVEISPSGSGLHIIVKATKPVGRNRKGFPDGQVLEMYDQGRYFTATGRVYEDEFKTYSTINSDASDVQDAVYAVFGKYLAVQEDEIKAQEASTVVIPPSHGLPVELIVKRIEAGKGGKKTVEGDSKRILDLWQGRWSQAGYPSHSEGDLALMNCLAFWTRKNAEAMERLFLMSGLYRAEKWGQVTDTSHGLNYGQQLIAKAIETTQVVYNPQIKSKATAYQSLEFPELDENGKPLSECIENTQYLLDYLGLEFKFNDVHHTVDVFKGIEQITLNYDSLIVELRSEAAKNGMKIGIDELHGICRNIADKNAYNPLIDYLKYCYDQNNKGADCEAEFENLCNCLVLDNLSVEETAFCYELLRLWLRQVVYLACNKGDIKPQSILVLKGPQGIGKSSLSARLLPRDLTLTEQGVEFYNKDSIIMCTSVGICELSELGSTVKDANKTKQFLTRESDTYRAPYDRTAQTYPRRTSYIGTVNDATFLIDNTGNRRFFILPLSHINWSKLNNVDLTKVWALMVKDFVERKPYQLDADQKAKVNQRNEKYGKLTEIEQILLDKLSWATRSEYWRWTTPSALCEELTGRNEKASVMGRRLQELADKGKIEQPQRRHNTGVAYYRLPPKVMEITDGNKPN